MKSWQVRYQTFERAYHRLSELAQMDLENKDIVYQEALIKRFEMAIQVTKNLLKAFLKEQGSELHLLEHPKNIIREAYRCGCLDQADVWLEAIGYRNQAAHIYHEDLLKRTVSFVQLKFWPELQTLEKYFQKQFKS